MTRARGSSERADDACRQVVTLELRLLDPETRRSAREVAALLADDFVEVGASGRLFGKEAAVAALASESAEVRWRPSPPVARELADGIVLVTYTVTRAEQGSEALSYCASIWRRGSAGWRLVHHQGTRLAEEPDGRERADQSV